MSQVKGSRHHLLRIGFGRILGISVVFSLVSLAPISIAICQSTGQTARIDTPMYSAIAATVYEGKSAASPDGKKNVSIKLLDLNDEDVPARVTVTIGKMRLDAKIRFGLDTEILWSPDSEAFALTGSHEGAGGQYETAVFYVNDTKLRVVGLTILIERAFGHPFNCWMPEVPNVVAVKWLVPSRKLLVAAQVNFHTNCDSFGTFRAYVVDLTGPLVIRSYNQIQAKKLFGQDLGRMLLESDDNCIRDPKSCVVNAYSQ